MARDSTSRGLTEEGFRIWEEKAASFRETASGCSLVVSEALKSGRLHRRDNPALFYFGHVGVRMPRCHGC